MNYQTASRASVKLIRQHPTIPGPHDVIIKVHAASVNPLDLKKAAGMFKMAIKEQFLYYFGYDCAGEVTAIGSEVNSLEVGDHVFTCLPEAHRGSWAGYAKCTDQYVAKMPSGMSFADAAVSGTGSIAFQLAKNVFHAGKVIMTVSTSKVSKIPELLGEGVVDQKPRSVDFLLDTAGEAMTFLPLMVTSTSLIVSVATQPSGTQLQESDILHRADKPKSPCFICLGLNMVDSGRRFYAKQSNVEYSYLFMEFSGKDLDEVRAHVEDGHLRPVVGNQVDIRDIDGTRGTCKMVFNGKGGVFNGKGGVFNGKGGKNDKKIELSSV
ncbi:GroES-like protein [Karstenula rhodostoma CBS 690.94]|uniref:GroES-like protein n=1 Tax=Karstenula rhodostoma CBS 690.94 TaxID=1392251 RepID=A0A9P4PNA6_9PLEO|nr:GroES-like protein [Karstenula rhodostoma CBS 690.94]